MISKIKHIVIMRKKAVWVEIAEKLGQSGECDNLYTYLNEKTFYSLLYALTNRFLLTD